MGQPYGTAQPPRDTGPEAAPLWMWREDFADGWGLRSAQRNKEGPTRGRREGYSRKRGGDQQRKEWGGQGPSGQQGGSWSSSEDGRMEQDVGPGGKSQEHHSQGLEPGELVVEQQY